VVACLALSSACFAGGDHTLPNRVTVHEDGAGPLSASSLPGRKALLAPDGNGGWVASFGTPLLCSTKAGMKIVLKGVRYDADPKPSSVTTQIRTVPAGRGERPGKQIEWAPFPGLLGEPGKFANWTVRGSYSPVPGYVIDTDCAAQGKGFSELVTTMRVPAAGVWVHRTFVDYRAGGVNFTLVIRWEMVGCGTATAQVCT
jgi:hypothetical protein